MEYFESWKDLVNPEFYIKLGGFWLVLFIIFAETGLFAGFFLPGDSLLFISGIYSQSIIRETFGDLGNDFLNTFLLANCITLAAVIGNEVGYYFGHRMGEKLYQKEDTLLFKKRYLYQADDFFKQKGSFAVIIARFLPIVRTFIPIVAGIVKMDKKKFLKDNIIGAILWAYILVFAGHYLYKILKDQCGFDLTHHLEIIVLVLVLVTTLPVIIKMFFGKTREK